MHSFYIYCLLWIQTLTFGILMCLKWVQVIYTEKESYRKLFEQVVVKGENVVFVVLFLSIIIWCSFLSILLGVNYNAL